MLEPGNPFRLKWDFQALANASDSAFQVFKADKKINTFLPIDYVFVAILYPSAEFNPASETVDFMAAGNTVYRLAFSDQPVCGRIELVCQGVTLFTSVIKVKAGHHFVERIPYNAKFKVAIPDFISDYPFNFFGGHVVAPNLAFWRFAAPITDDAGFADIRRPVVKKFPGAFEQAIFFKVRFYAGAGGFLVLV